MPPREAPSDWFATDEAFRLLVESVRDYAIFMLDPTGRIATWNPGAERIKGYRADEILGQHFSTFYPAEDRSADKPARELAGAARDGRFEDEGWRLRKDGSRFWANVIITAMRDEHGTLRGFAKVTRDLTERRRAEEATRANAASLSATLLSIGDGVIATDREGKVQLMNPVAERLTGVPLEAARGRPCVESFHIVNEHTRATVVNPLERVLREGVVVGLANHTVLISRDGQERAIADSGAPIRDLDGQLVGAVIVFRDISSERAREESLRQSEERFRLLVDSVKDYAIFMLDRDGHVVSWNQGAERLKGYGAAEILGKHFSVFYPEEERSAGRPARVLAIAAAEGRVEDEGWRLRKDGTRFWASVVVTAVHDEMGTLRGFAKVTRDFSERRQAAETERQLVAEATARRVAEDAQRRIAAILASLSDAVSVQEPSGRVIYANDAAARLVGLTKAAELVHGDLAEIVDRFRVFDERGEPLPIAQLPGRRALGGEEPAPMLLQFEDKRTRRRRWSLVKASAVAGADGKPILAVNVVHDVTEERRAGDVARFLAQASSLLGAGLEDERMLQRVADLAAPIFGGWVTFDLLDGDERRVARAGPPGDPTGSGVALPLSARGERLGTLTVVRSGGELDDEGRRVAQELARRAGIAADNVRLYREARKAVAIRDDFLSIAGHELRTPLAALSLQVASINLLLDRGDTKVLRERAEKMAGQCRRIERLIRDLLDVSRITSGKMELARERFDLAALVAEVIDRFSEEIAVSECRVDYQSDPVEGEWDRHRIDQVVTNLIANAVKYGRGERIEVRVFRRGGRAVLVVRDFGIGIPAADQERIFERFERAALDRNVGGLGLGLWIARQIVEQHGGSIDVESAPNRGSRFSAELPC